MPAGTWTPTRQPYMSGAPTRGVWHGAVDSLTTQECCTRAPARCAQTPAMSTRAAMPAPTHVIWHTALGWSAQHNHNKHMEPLSNGATHYHNRKPAGCMCATTRTADGPMQLLLAQTQTQTPLAQMQTPTPLAQTQTPTPLAQMQTQTLLGQAHAQTLDSCRHTGCWRTSHQLRLCAVDATCPFVPPPLPDPWSQQHTPAHALHALGISRTPWWGPLARALHHVIGRSAGSGLHV